MIDRICVGVDGSACSWHAAAVGLAIADRTDASVDVVRVLTDAESPDADDAWNGDRVLDELEEAVDPSTLDGLDVRGHAIEGSPADAIADFAAERDADLLILGRRGLDGLGDRLLGSVVHAVLRKADRPVLTVPVGESFELRDLLVPTDGSDAAERAAHWGAHLASLHGSSAHTCYVLDLAREGGLFSAGGLSETEIDRMAADRDEHVDRLADALRETDPDLSVERAILRDEPDAGIAEYVDREGIDLVVMSTSGARNATGQVIGSVTAAVLERVDVPVLAVPR
ncbi:hypothetical protein GCM10028857_09300 [Salinarchaeum chitinilyticum]